MRHHSDQEATELGNGSAKTVVITGAFGYTGKYATRILLARRYRIRTLTHHPERENPFADKVQAFPYNFEHPERLTETLRGASALIAPFAARLLPRESATRAGSRRVRFGLHDSSACGHLRPRRHSH